MVNRAVAHLGDARRTSVRLDAPTSGLLLFGKTLPAARDLAYQFRMRQLSKQYLAALLGPCEDDAFEVDAPIAPHPEHRTLSLALRADEAAALGGKRSLTRFEVLARAEAATLVAARPLTGRMHQIRVHADWRGHPIAGDTQYGAAHRAPAAWEAAPSRRLMLHAHTLQIRHPDDGRGMPFTAAPTADFLEALQRLGIDAADADVASAEGSRGSESETSAAR